MIEFSFLGIGGGGSVVAGHLLGDAAVKAGLNIQSFSIYGTQRRGGKIVSFLRVSEDEIRPHNRVYEPDFIIVTEESEVQDLLLTKSEKEQMVAKGGGMRAQTDIKKGATVLINTSKPKSEFSALKDCNVVTIDANRIASEKKLTLPSGLPIINTVLLGALVRLIPSVKMDHLIEAIKEGGIPAPERNIEAAQEAYQRVKEAPVAKKAAVAETTAVIGQRHPRINTDDCTMCELCYIYCPDLAISLAPDGLSFTINRNFCKACGICINECPRKAISWEAG